MTRFRAIPASLSKLSLRARVAIAAALAVGLAVLVTAGAAYLAVRAQLLDEMDRSLVDRAQAAVSGPLADPARLVQVPAEALGAGDLRIAVVRGNGEAFSAEGANSAPPLGESELRVARGVDDESLRTATLDGDRYRVAAVPAGPGLALVMAQRTAPTDRILGQLGLITVIAGTVGIGVAAWAGYAIARTALRPVRRLTAAAERVAQTQELDPIPVVGHDELASLTRSFNAMLLALREAQDRQRRLIADAGHELRTPLTSLRTNLDLLVQSDAGGGLDATDRAHLLADVRAQIEEMSALVTDLVELSREDIPAEGTAPLDLADVTRSAVTRARLRGPDVTYSVDLRPWPVEGDVQLLERAVLNLLDNARKWSPPGGVVTVRLRDGELTVADEGPGIADEDLPHVFERFYRSTQARSEPGSGLGLAIVKQAAQRHGGTVTAGRADSGGALMTLRLPALAPAAEETAPTQNGNAEPPRSSTPLGVLSASSQNRPED